MGILIGVELGMSVMGKNLVGVSSRENSRRRKKKQDYLLNEKKLVGQWMKKDVSSRELCNFVF